MDLKLKPVDSYEVRVELNQEHIGDIYRRAGTKNWYWESHGYAFSGFAEDECFDSIGDCKEALRGFLEDVV